MLLTRFDDVHAFIAEALPLVAHDPARHAALQGWVDAVVSGPPTDKRFMATWRDGPATGVGAQNGEWPLGIGDAHVAAADAFADVLAREQPALTGVVGKRASCEAFARRWWANTGRVPRLRFHLRNHMLAALHQALRVSGGMRSAVVADAPWVLAMQHAFATEARIVISAQAATRLTDERISAGALRIWTDGEDVAFAGFRASGPDAARIGPVYTRPEHRGRGYAGALVRSICAELVYQRRRVFLVTDVANPTSNQLYARLGFVPLDDSHQFDLVDP
ncbi:MAG TPA: GNAT family N-acetyltransferase [Casimicrobiaceae bacterium]|nr:GNAT family N-acetyltransferase [Casimicrobiaceae bacterium]